MAVRIRLSRHGRKKLPFYRLVAADRQSPRGGRFLEVLGTLNTLTSPATVELNEERIKYWIGVGATPSDTVAQLIEKQYPGYFSSITSSRVEKIRKQRSKRKERASKNKTAKS